MDFTVNDLDVGTRGSEVRLERPGTVRVTARVACLLPENPESEGGPDPTRQPFWTPEHARIAGSRDVTVEVVINGRPVSSTRVLANGTLREVAFDVPVDRSSWIALRVLGSAHTNPIFVLIGERPIRASRRSAEWCLSAVDQCWSQKSRRLRGAVRDQADRAYEHARSRYRQILAESDD